MTNVSYHWANTILECAVAKAGERLVVAHDHERDDWFIHGWDCALTRGAFTDIGPAIPDPFIVLQPVQIGDHCVVVPEGMKITQVKISSTNGTTWTMEVNDDV